MKDSFGRNIEYLRISVTDRCNLRCQYCMPEEGVHALQHDEILRFEEICRIVEAAAQLGIHKFRITGGEPLARKGIVGLIDQLHRIPGVKELVMTTNGTLLADQAEALSKAGLNRVNISLDSLRPDRYKEITRGGNLQDVFDGIHRALRAGLGPVKINVVVIGGFNDDEILDFAQLSLNHHLTVRFIELMPIGTAGGEHGAQMVSNQFIKERLSGLVPVEDTAPGEVAEYYRFRGALGKIGFISPLSRHFCAACNKIRLTPDGKLKPCLHTEEEIDLRPALDTGDPKILLETIRQTIASKNERHHLNEGATPIQRDMNRIGG